MYKIYLLIIAFSFFLIACGGDSQQEPSNETIAEELIVEESVNPALKDFKQFIPIFQDAIKTGDINEIAKHCYFPLKEGYARGENTPEYETISKIDFLAQNPKERFEPLLIVDKFEQFYHEESSYTVWFNDFDYDEEIDGKKPKGKSISFDYGEGAFSYQFIATNEGFKLIAIETISYP